MQPTKLEEHRFIKGKFITPFNEIGSSMTGEESWVYGRLPEYIWIGLIFDYYGRKEALKRLHSFIDSLENGFSELATFRLSDIFSLREESQKLFYELMLKYIEKEVLTPLTAIFHLSKHRVFVETFYNKIDVNTSITHEK